MTEDQIAQWKRERDIARKIEDPESRKRALEEVYDHRDEMQMTCIAHQANRIKQCLANDIEMERNINDMRSEVKEVKKDMKPLQESDREFREAKIEARGMNRLIGWVKIACASGLGGIVMYIIQNWSAH